MITKLSIIGHTNTGKTSLMRTLLRDDEFGEVKNASATTRHTTKTDLFGADGKPLLSLFDTPGLEDATGVMDYLHAHTSERDDGIDRLRYFLEKVSHHDPETADFSQEAKAVQALMDSDLALYVIDARTPPTDRYKDELAILVYSAVPILPVFNFTAHTEYMTAWQGLLARRALHIAVQFDTVAFDFNNEMSLWQTLATMTATLPNPTAHKDNFHAIIRHRTDLWADLYEEGNAIIADFLINVASLSHKIDEQDDPAPTISTLQQAVRQGERIAMELLSKTYKFYHSPLENDRPEIHYQTLDPFDKSLLAHYGLRTAGGTGAGVMIGAGLDVATLGASLGLGTVVGGLLGGGLANAGTIKDKLTHKITLTTDDNTLLILANRLIALHQTLRQTGHATQGAIGFDKGANFLDKLPKPLTKARSKPHYTSLNGKAYDENASLRFELADKLSVELMALNYG